MQLLMVTYYLEGVSDADYRATCAEEAPAFATVPGLVSKAWIADEATNTYGGVYTFADRASMDSYVASELFRSIGDDPTVGELTTRVFDVLDEPSRITHVAAR
jgi:hypothetical protein